MYTKHPIFLLHKKDRMLNKVLKLLTVESIAKLSTVVFLSLIIVRIAVVTKILTKNTDNKHHIKYFYFFTNLLQHFRPFFRLK